jgi:hypothetical protein
MDSYTLPRQSVLHLHDDFIAVSALVLLLGRLLGGGVVQGHLRAHVQVARGSYQQIN